MVTYSTLSICHFALPLSLSPSVHAAACVSCHCRVEHTQNYILSPTNPPCGYISLFGPVCLTAVRPIFVSHDCRPVAWTQGCVCSFSMGFNHITELGLCGKDPLDFWHVFWSLLVLQGWRAYCTLPLHRGNFAQLQQRGKVNRDIRVWKRQERQSMMERWM